MNAIEQLILTTIRLSKRFGYVLFEIKRFDKFQFSIVYSIYPTNRATRIQLPVQHSSVKIRAGGKFQTSNRTIETYISSLPESLFKLPLR